MLVILTAKQPDGYTPKVCNLVHDVLFVVPRAQMSRFTAFLERKAKTKRTIQSSLQNIGMFRNVEVIQPVKFNTNSALQTNPFYDMIGRKRRTLRLAKTAARQRSLPTAALIARTSAGKKPMADLLSALPCNLAHVPSDIELIYVLDDMPRDREFGKCLDDALKRYRGHLEQRVVRVVYEPEPAAGKHMFTGRLEGGPGKDRSQWSNFWADNYTDAPVIGFLDGEVCIHTPLLLEQV